MEFLGTGRTRMVFRNGNYVVKVPLCERGIEDNHWERGTFLRSRREGSWIQYARCRLIGDILIMQYARFPGPLATESGYIPLKNCPDWAYFVDCQQVGYTRFGALVAYDYGIH